MPSWHTREHCGWCRSRYLRNTKRKGKHKDRLLKSSLLTNMPVRTGKGKCCLPVCRQMPFHLVATLKRCVEQQQELWAVCAQCCQDDKVEKDSNHQNAEAAVVTDQMRNPKLSNQKAKFSERILP